MTSRKVFVLGAGFTRAFFPRAPLLVDSYCDESVSAKFEQFPRWKALLQSSRIAKDPSQIDLERLMTRLAGPMPYDRGADAEHELALLLSELKKSFVRRVEAATTDWVKVPQIKDIARHCVDEQIACITFNYDTLLDWALWDVRKVTGIPMGDYPYWHPDGGYGFFCRPSISCVRDSQVFMDPAKVLLLKLHGSINWRRKLGYSTPASLDAIVHHETWMQEPLDFNADVPMSEIEGHLDPDPFFVPPILSKPDLRREPVFTKVWSLAYDALVQASEVAFVGYSCPRTDLAASYLFGEAIQPGTAVTVVNLASDESSKSQITATYREVLPANTQIEFKFHGALAWFQESGIVGLHELVS